MKIRDHVSLREVSWFHTGGVAEYFVSCTTLAEVMEAIEEAHRRDVAFRVIGHSSNLLMSDAGFAGMIIQNQAESVVFLHDRSQIIVDSGTPLATLISQTLSQGYSGLEFLTGVPGTLGGAIYNNATAFGKSIGDYVRHATLFISSQQHNKDEAVKRVDREWFRFAYRSSRLKELRNAEASVAPVLLSVTLQLSKMSPASCLQRLRYYQQLRQSYPATQESMLQIFDSLCLSKQEITERTYQGRKDLPCHLVDRANLKNWRINEITTITKNPNFIIQQGVGTSRDAANLIKAIQQNMSVDHIPLEPTIEFMGLWEDQRAQE